MAFPSGSIMWKRTTMMGVKPISFTVGDFIRLANQECASSQPALRQNLALRWAIGTAQLQDLPHGLATMHTVLPVMRWYEACANALSAANEKGDEQFDLVADEISRDMAKRAGDEMKSVAKAIQQLQAGPGAGQRYHQIMQADIDAGLRAFNGTRIGIRLITDILKAKRLEGSASSTHGRPRQQGAQAGGFQVDCSVTSIAKGAAAYVEDICEENFYACRSLSSTAMIRDLYHTSQATSGIS